MIQRPFYFLVDDDGHRWPVWTDDITIGSAPTNTLVVPEPSVAAVQTRVWRAFDRCWVRDEGALYGTLVNGQPVQGDHELHPGEVVAVGSRTYRLDLGPFSPARAPAAKRWTERGTALRTPRLPLPALLTPAVLMVVVLGAALLARAAAQRQVPAVELQRAVSDAEGVAHFLAPSGSEANILVRSEYVMPWPDVVVAYLPGADSSYEAYFSFYDGLLTGVAFFPGALAREINDVPNVMFRANQEQVQAITGFLRDLGYGPDAYVGAVSPEVYANPDEQPEGAVRIAVYGNGQVHYGVQRSGLVDRFQYEGGTPASARQWDCYELTFRDRTGEGPYAVKLYAASQAPVMSQVSELLPETSGQVRVSFLAIDPWVYPGHPDLAFALEDHTLALGPTFDSDLEYHYRVLDGGGGVAIDWVAVQQKAVCTPDGCRPTEATLHGLSSGTYTLEVYAVDEVENQSGVATLELLVGE